MILRRIDHSMIYLLVAGSYTPFCLALGGGAASTLLPLVWGAALLGMLKSVLWVKAPRFVTALAYVLLGWAVVPWAPELGATLGNTALILIGLGGLFYSVGAVIYARKSPDPNPKVFGYHEIFHVLVIAAAVCHYGAVWLTVT
jgi:hemolysin III